MAIDFYEGVLLFFGSGFDVDGFGRGHFWYGVRSGIRN